jgi:hypothetical protein
MPDARKTGIWSLSWMLAALVLLVAIVVQDVGLGHGVTKAAAFRLADVVRVTLPGWRFRDMPLGPSEFLASEAEKVLNFDDVVYREFTHKSTTFEVYVAYWGSGKMPAQLVASHTPDRCWTENGWKCLSMKFRQPESVGGEALQPAEWRLFETPQGGGQVYVLYWHLVAGKAYDYGSRFNAIPDPLQWWKGALQQALLGSPEQYFVRITSNQPIDELWGDEGFAEVIHQLTRLGLAATR